MQQQPDNNHNASSQSTELFHLMVKNFKDYAIFMIDTERRVISWNSGVERLLGYTEDEIVGKSGDIIFTPEDIAADVPVKEQETAIRNGSAEDKRWHLRKDGSQFWVNVMLMQLKNEDGTLRGYAKVMRDDTEQKLLEERLRQSEEFNRSILESSVDCVKVLSLDGNLLSMNAPGLCIMEIDEFSDFQGRRWSDFWTGEGHAKALRAVESARNGEIGRFQGYAETAKGTRKYWDVIVSPILDEDGKPKQILSVSRDISQQKSNEEALAKSERRFENILESITDCFFVLDSERRFTYVNSQTEAYFGFSKEQMLGHSYTEVLPQTKGHEILLRQDEALLKRKPVHFETQSPVTGKWIELHNYPTSDGLAVYFRDVTDRKQAEEKLRQSEERFRALIIQATAGITQNDKTGKFTFVNDRYCEIVGYSSEELLNMRMQDISDPEIIPANLELYRGIWHDGTPFVIEKQYIRKDGSCVWVNNSVAPVVGVNGKTESVVCITIDITERKQAEEAARASNELFQIVAQATNDAIWDWNLSTNKLTWNEGVQTLFGYAPEQVSDSVEWWYEHLHPEDKERVIEGIHQVIDSNGQEWSDEYRFIKADDSYTEVLDRGFVIRNGEGNPVRMLGGMTDITERKRAEGILQRYRLLSDKARDIVWMLRPDGQIVEVNQAAVDAYGYSREELLAMNVRDLREPSTRPRVAEDLKKSAEGVNFETVHIRKDGTTFPVEVNANSNNFGEERLVMSIVRDITERKRSEEALRESEERFRYVADAAPVLIWISDTTKQCNWFNKPWLSFTGRTLEEEYGNGWAEGVHPEDFHRCVEIYSSSFDIREPFSMEYRLRRYDGEYRWLLDNGIPRFAPNGEFLGFIGSCIDITDRKQIESEREWLLKSEQESRQQAEQANRLKDEFLATLSHELRTPLNAILGWAQVLQNRSIGENEVEKALTTIERNARSQSQLIDDILDVSRIITGKLRLNVRAVDLPEVIMAAIDAARPAAEAKNIRLQTLLDPQAGLISGDADRLQQVVWNLLSNAIKFTPKDGHVQVRLERINSHVDIVVSDTGIGIESGFLPYVFERFRQSDASTTRRHGGLGLGLAIVRQLVELHGGSVSVSSEGEGKGSTFNVNLPLLPVRIEPENEIASVQPMVRTKETNEYPPELSGLRVLVVEDEADSRDLLKLVLGSCGAEVSVSSSAAEAFELIKGGRFDVIVSDIGMPEEDGYSLISKIRDLPNEQGGNVPAVALTAYARTQDRVRAIRSGFQMHIAKPVEPSELIAVVVNLAGRKKRLNQNEDE
jgi:PAS domain S-box-containing protein